MNAAPDELQAPLDAAEGQADRHSLLNPRCVPAAQHTAATDGRAAVALGCCGSAAAVALREPTLRARPPLRFLFRNLAGLFAADPDCANRRAGQLPQRAMMFAGSSVDDEIELKKLQARARGRERETERESSGGGARLATAARSKPWGASTQRRLRPANKRPHPAALRPPRAGLCAHPAVGDGGRAAMGHSQLRARCVQAQHCDRASRGLASLQGRRPRADVFVQPRV